MADDTADLLDLAIGQSAVERKAEHLQRYEIGYGKAWQSVAGTVVAVGDVIRAEGGKILSGNDIIFFEPIVQPIAAHPEAPLIDPDYEILARIGDAGRKSWNVQ